MLIVNHSKSATSVLAHLRGDAVNRPSFARESSANGSNGVFSGFDWLAALQKLETTQKESKRTNEHSTSEHALSKQRAAICILVSRSSLFSSFPAASGTDGLLS